MPAGTRAANQPSASDRFIQTPSHKQLLAEMMQSHMVKDICLIGGKVRQGISICLPALSVWTERLRVAVPVCRVVGKRSSLRTLLIS